GQAVADTDPAGPLREAAAPGRARGRGRRDAGWQPRLRGRGHRLPQGERGPRAHPRRHLRGRGLHHKHGRLQHDPGGDPRRQPHDGPGARPRLQRDDREARPPGGGLPPEVRHSGPRHGESRHKEVPEGPPPGESRRHAPGRRGPHLRRHRRRSGEKL
ncbi:MAG: Putative iron-sulfur cluster assembly scaffold protein for SUF system, SufE2, partial [uncultured Rubrobacteraceae bacterium]